MKTKVIVFYLHKYKIFVCDTVFFSGLLISLNRSEYFVFVVVFFYSLLVEYKFVAPNELSTMKLT